MLNERHLLTATPAEEKMYRTHKYEEKTVDGVQLIINELRWVDGERTYEVVRAGETKPIPGGDDFLHPPHQEDLAALLAITFLPLEEYELTASALYECGQCGAIVSKTDVHQKWHNRVG